MNELIASLGCQWPQDFLHTTRCKECASSLTPQGKQISVSAQDLNRKNIENRAFPERKCKLIVMLAKEVKDDTTSGAQTKQKTKFWEVYERLKFVKTWRLGETRVQM